MAGSSACCMAPLGLRRNTFLALDLVRLKDPKRNSTLYADTEYFQ